MNDDDDALFENTVYDGTKIFIELIVMKYSKGKS
jgi:hypothetical protein